MSTIAKPLKMSDTALKFGPEWLRALSHGDTAISPPPSPSLGAPRYKLAKHRYGREEMLALYDKTMKAPDDLAVTPPLYSEKTQTPLALIQMSDEEMRMWQRGVNSDVVLKLMGRSTGPSVGGGGGGGSTLGAVGVSRGSRGGGSVDRGGRGRGRGGIAGAYNRGTSYEDDGGLGGDLVGRRGDGPPIGYGRGGARPFERSQSSSERVWVERPDRNGTEDWNGSTSPRKELGGGGGGGAGTGGRPENNWRAREALKEQQRERAEGGGGGKEDEDGWRTAGRAGAGGGERWGTRTAGWRSERATEGDREGAATEEGGGRVERPHRPWEDEGGRPAGFKKVGGHHPNRRAWDDGPDSLPEWVQEDLQGGGTFDASGAFRDERWPDGTAAGGSTSADILDSSGDKKRRAVAVNNKKPDGQPTSADQQQQQQPSGKDVSIEAKKPISSPSKSEPKTSETTAPVAPPNKEPPQQAKVDVDDGLELHAQAVVSTLVAQLVDQDEDQPPPNSANAQGSPSPPNHLAPEMDQWFYRDPQGEVQGPFSSAEMTEWFNSGYFTMGLSVRRACDERYVQLGELAKLWGRLPFLPSVHQHQPPMKLSDVHPMVAEQEKLQMMQQQMMQQQMFQQQMQIQHQQQHLMRQQAVVAKLALMDGWSSLPPAQQQQIVNQHMANLPPLPPLPTDPLMQQLRLQMEAQAKMQSAQSMVVNNHHHMQQQQAQQDPAVLDASMSKQDPIQAFVQQLLNQSTTQKPLASVNQKPSNGINNNQAPPQEAMDPIQSLLQQAQWQAESAVQPGVPGQQVAPGFHGMAPGPGLVPWPPHTLSVAGVAVPSNALLSAGPPVVDSHQAQPPMTSVWDLEKAKVEEATKQRQLMVEQQQMVEMHRRAAEEEQKRLKEEEERRRMIREREQREEMLRREDEMRRQHQEEMRRQQQEELKQQQLEEERMRLEEEERHRHEEEQQRRQQMALQRLQEQQMAAQAQARAQAAAAQQLQQQQQAQAKAKAAAAQAVSAPWVQKQQQQAESALTMADIQRMQEEKEAIERAQAQAQRAEETAKAAALAQQQQQQAAIKLRWANKQAVQGTGSIVTPSVTPAKSLAEIQAEEASQLARLKEKEAKERASQQSQLNLATTGAWGASHGSSSGSGGSVWGSGRTAAAVVAQHTQSQPQAQQQQQQLQQANHSNNLWKSGSVGFWEDPSPAAKPTTAATKAAAKTSNIATKVAQSTSSKSSSSAKPPTAASVVASKAAGPASSSKPATQLPVGANPAAATSKKNNRSNKEEEAVKKLFSSQQQAVVEKKDSFSQWCFEYLKKVQAPIDVPTFVSFLKDVESPFEVQDYVRSYLGEGREAKEFAKQFLEQRSRWRQLQRSVQQGEEDNMCIPAKAVNPGQPTDFHEVKSKSKKSKKKMQKVDASLLGFSVSASTDRINVGERDFVDGM